MKNMSLLNSSLNGIGPEYNFYEALEPEIKKLDKEFKLKTVLALCTVTSAPYYQVNLNELKKLLQSEKAEFETNGNNIKILTYNNLFEKSKESIDAWFKDVDQSQLSFGSGDADSLKSIPEIFMETKILFQAFFLFRIFMPMT